MIQGMVSVIVLSWNSRDFLEGCLASVEAQTHGSVELIVVDNASTDGSPDLVRRGHPAVTLVENSRNLGFCAGNNVGLKRARGAYILFLNADAVLEPTYVEEALKSFAADGRIGMVAGKVLRFDRRTLDTTGQILARSRRALERGYGEVDRGQYDRPGEVFSVCGAAALYSRALIDAISIDGELFDEDFFAFGEDLDVGWRARRAGWRCAYQPAAVAAHYRGGTQSQREAGPARRRQMIRRPPQVQAHIVKNRYLTMIKNESLGSFLTNLPFIACWDLALWGYMLLRRPATVPILWRHRHLARAAWRKRRLATARSAFRAAAS